MAGDNWRPPRRETGTTAGVSWRESRLLLIPTDRAPPVPPENPREELVGNDPWRNKANSLKSETAEDREPLDRERLQKGKDTEAEQGFMEKRGWDGEL